MNTVWILLFAPLGAVAVITLLTQRWKRLSALISCAAVLVSFGLSLGLLGRRGEWRSPEPLQWLMLEDRFKIEFGAVVDRLSVLMLLVVSGVGLAIHVYSLGYMKDDRGWSRYFACLSLFTFSMLGIVISTNFIQLFIFWELVGVSSYLLIGHWFERPSAAEAAQKAFLVNRIGDFGMMLGVLMLWQYLGTFEFREIQRALAVGTASPLPLGLIGALIFCGAVGKSAQFPLHVWLPDAMEGPTPVSALIHAATMVAAGVYMLCRVSFLILPSEAALTLIAWTGGITALMAAAIAVTQNDIKRILAYSTLSQLGYMIMAVGVGGTTPAMFHLTTHAFFKALLFLAAGSVIVALHHEQDIWKMGGLWRKLPVTFGTFLVGTLALAGVWPLSGFYSKDEILLVTWNANKPLFLIAVTTAFLTAYYMGRECFVVFFGKPRDPHAYEHARESPAVMTVPLVFLAILSVIGGWGAYVPRFLDPLGELPHSAWTGLLLVAPALGFLLAARIYLKPCPSDAPVKAALGPVWTWMEHKFYFDEFYLWLVKYVQGAMAATCEWCDRWILQRLGIGGLAATTQLAGRTLRLLQTGNLRTYAFLFAISVTVLVYWMAVR